MIFTVLKQSATCLKPILNNKQLETFAILGLTRDEATNLLVLIFVFGEHCHV